MIDAAGNGDGVNTLGSVFKLTPAAGGKYTESDLHVFSGETDSSRSRHFCSIRLEICTGLQRWVGRQIWAWCLR